MQNSVFMTLVIDLNGRYVNVRSIGVHYFSPMTLQTKSSLRGSQFNLQKQATCTFRTNLFSSICFNGLLDATELTDGQNHYIMKRL